MNRQELATALKVALKVLIREQQKIQAAIDDKDARNAIELAREILTRQGQTNQARIDAAEQQPPRIN